MARLALLLTAVVALAFSASSTSLRSVSGASLTAALSSSEQRVVDLVNQERAAAGLPGLVVSDALSVSARAYASYMAQANFFGHIGPDGSNLVTRNQAAGYGDYAVLAENLAAGQRTPEAAMAGWLASPSHRANIFLGTVREIGVGYAAGGNYGHYWVQEFGKRPVTYGLIAPATAQSTLSSATWVSPATGHSVTGPWLAFLKANGDIDNLGQPRTEVIADPLTGQTVQYFQRAVLEYHPENPEPYRIQRRLLGDILNPGADAPVTADEAPVGESQYFPLSSNLPTGLGHFVGNYTKSGQAIHFFDFFRSRGGVTAFGYPKEEPKLRDGRWVQRFQAASFEYHQENDRDGVIAGTNIPYRNYRVQLALLGDAYIARNGLPFH